MKTKWQTASGKEVLRKNLPWKTLHFYKKSDLLYQMTSVFCKRFLPAYGDRTVNQMIQAALGEAEYHRRDGRRNDFHGMELKLINVARSSLKELRADYEDYIKSRQLQLWKNTHPRYAPLLEHCRSHNEYSDYEPFIYRWTDEEFCNTAVTLLHITDRMMSRYHEFLQKTFVEQGGIKERIYAARTGYRRQQDELLKRLQQENAGLKAENDRLRKELAKVAER